MEKAEQDPDKSRRTAFVSNLDYSIDEDRIGQIFAKVEISDKEQHISVYKNTFLGVFLFYVFFLCVKNTLTYMLEILWNHLNLWGANFRG